ncbi:DUF3164 family protein [Pseudoxanthomonas sp. 22568]|uniref:DUF3164 family protein n=1 Tax=Pseudoxanthomonas sp. 22568 TaxID=3453945 RepID=UPI003F866E69
MNTETIPAGYRKDAKGRLVPEAQIREIDLMRDKMVMEIVAKARELSALLSAFRLGTLDDIAAFVSLSAEQYKVALGGKKGNVQLLSYDGQFKVLRAIADRITFDERIQAAKALIDECLTEWTEGAASELRLIVQDAFDVDKQGNISTGKILELRRYKIDDARWKRAMTAIAEGLQVVSTKPYIRIYELNQRTGKYEPLVLDVAGV